MALAERFHTVFLEDLPRLTAAGAAVRAELDRLSAAGVDRADGEVVDVRVGVRRVGLRRRVRRAADDPLPSHERPRRGGGAVVLADVHAVGLARLHEVGPVVEDHGHPA